jgi:hypothetical protein
LLFAASPKSALPSFVFAIAMRTSWNAPSAPPEEQRDYEQHKEYEKPQLRDACRRRCDAAKSKNRRFICEEVNICWVCSDLLVTNPSWHGRLLPSLAIHK